MIYIDYEYSILWNILYLNQDVWWWFRLIMDIRSYDTFSTLIKISDNDLERLQIFASMNILYLNQDVWWWFRSIMDIRSYETFSTLINMSDDALDWLQIFAPMKYSLP